MIEIHNQCVTFEPPVGAAYLIGDFTDWDEEPLPIAGPLTLEFPQGAYIEYAFLDAQKEPLPDPTNPVKPKHPWYDYHRSITLPQNNFHMPPRPQTFRGSVHEHTITSRIFADQRTYYVYEPALTPAATLYVHDGEAFYRNLQFHEVAEALLEQKAINPVRLVMIEPRRRKEEYWFNGRYEAFLLEEILPEIEQRYGLTVEKGSWGASLG